MKKLRELTGYEYDSTQNSGLPHELLPEATGDYDDCEKHNMCDEDGELHAVDDVLDLADVFRAVQNINADIASALPGDEDETECLTLMTDGFVCIVKFGEERIWHSREDNRAFIEEENEYEDLEMFLRSSVHELLIQRQGQYEAIANVIYDTL
jgi:hypothetical protein